ncbi:maleylpyruvate isomerase N-terminal domain-containing protein [Desertimonas flava]|uniref:maleylpyruvate isomerase N-terminal domain-containing protein n=1 Tax=Desertimonas flava TaxID=2064846 RepID=UPI0013C4DE96|nr:maleylpyruvate isomerase N-terminal domain-containing protein [Desertimonas flava]
MAWPVEPPADALDCFSRERAALLDLLHGLEADDWSRPSACPEWSVLGLTTHVVGDDLSLLARHRDGYLGTVPPVGAPNA